MHDQGDSDDAVGDEHAEVLADGGVAEHGAARAGDDDEQQVEQQRAKQRLTVRSLDDGRAAHEDGRARVEADLLVRAIGLQRAEVLREDQVAKASQHGGEDDGDDARLVHVDARGVGDHAVLADGAELLAEAGLHDDHVEQAQQADHQEGDHRHAHEEEDLVHSRELHGDDAGGQNRLDDDQAAQRGTLAQVEDDHHHGDEAREQVQRRRELQRPQVIQRLADAGGAGHIQRVGNARGALDDQAVGVQGDEVAEDEEEEQLVKTVGKVAEDHTADHFLALHLVEQLADEEAEQRGDGNGHQRGDEEAADAGDLPLQHPEDGDLRRHRADGDGEVDAHAGDDGDDQRQHDEGVARQTVDQLHGHVGGRFTREDEAGRAEDDEDDGDDVLTHPLADRTFVSHASHLPPWSAHRV